MIECDPERLGVIVEHVIRNAQDATADDGSVTLMVGIGAPWKGGSEMSRETSGGTDTPGGGTASGDGVTVATDTNARLRVPHAILTVSDTGTGMSREFVQERLFKPFDTTKGSKGMGIGAYQVREYVQSLGGRVEVESEPGRGTHFRLLLPLAISEIS